LFDRFDMAVDVAEVKTLDMLNQASGEASEKVGARVAAARELQKARFSGLGLPYRLNTELYGDTLHALVTPDDRGKKLLEQATEQLRLSMRGYTRVLRVARTIADLEQSETVNQQHIGEALSYRQMQFGRVAEEV
jgi:magnesium chelatase family protein